MKLVSLFFVFLMTSAFAAESPRTLYWEDLMPEGEIEELERQYDAYYESINNALGAQDWQSLFEAGAGAVEEGSPQDFMPQLGTFNVVEELDGEKVRIPGFVLPFEYSASGKIREFLLVPYFGACIHTPPPPPNQLVYVTADKPVPLGEQWDAIWATGVLRATRNMNDLGNAAYTLEIESWESYDG